MAVFKATQNKSDSAGKFKATKNRSYDSTLVYDWETRNKESYDSLEKYRQRINSGGYLSADDLTAYRKALDSYLETSTSLRGFAKAMGQGKDDDDAWTKTIADMESGYQGISDYFSQWKTEDAFNASLAAQKDRDEKLKLDTTAYRSELEALEAQRDALVQELDAADSSIGTENVDRAAMDLVGKIEELEKQIQEKKLYLSEAERLQEGVRLSSVSGSEDFDDFNDYVSTEYGEGLSWDKLFNNDYGLGYEDLTYEYINNQNGIRGEIDRKASIYGKGSSDGESRFKANGYDLMHEDEIAIYNYYYAKEGKDAAEKYLNSIQETLNSRKAAGMYENLEDNFLLEMAFGVVAGIDQFKSGMEGLADAFSGNDEYRAPSATQMASGMVREDLSDVDLKWYNFKDKAWGDAKIFGNSLGQAAYDSVTTTSNMLPSILTSAAVNFVAPGAGSYVGTTLLGASAGGNAYREMINLGYDKGQARAYAAMVGGSEAIMQSLLGGISSLSGGGTEGIFQSIAGKLLPHVDKAFARTAIKLGANMLDEGLEEGLQEILNPWFQNLVLNADAKVDWSEVAYSSLLGALTAGIMEGPGTVYGEVNAYTQGKKLLKSDFSAQRLAELGKTFAADTEAYQLAGKVNENTGAYTIGRLFNEIGATMTEQNVNDITNALVAKGWDEVTARKNAEALAYVVEGGQLTDRQTAIIEANEGLAEVARSVLIDANSTVNQRTKGYNEALMALAQEKSGAKSSGTNPAQQSEENAPTTDTVDTPSENGAESASEADTGPAKVKSIAAIKNKRATVALEDGTEADVRDVDLDPDDGVRIETIASIDGISSTDANFIFKTLRENTGASAQMDSLGAKDAYRYGFYGFSKDLMTKQAVFANSLTEAQRNAIYEVGQKARQQQIEKASPKTTAKQRGIYFDHGGGNVVEFKDADKKTLTEDKRKAGVQVALVLNKLGIGGSIYFFESYRNANGQLVYRDSTGKEVKAPNGWYSEKDGSIHIDLNAGRGGNGLVMFTLAHELTHFIEQWSPAKYKILADFLIENYEKGQSMDALIRRKQAKLSEMRGEKISYDEAYSEVIADSMEAMLADGNVLEKLIELKAKDQSLFNKMKQFFDNLLTKIRNAYKGQAPDSYEGNAVMEMTDSIERIQQLFAEALVEASDNFQASLTPGEEGVAVNESGEPVAHATSDGTIQLSMRTYEEDGRKAFRDYLNKCVKNDRLTQAEMQEMLNGIEEIYQVCKEFKDKYAPFSTWSDAAVIRDTYGKPVFSVVTPNGDYKMNLDFSLVCKKRRTLDAVFNEMSKRGIIDDFELGQKSVVKINEIIRKYGLETACALCFVDAKRFRQASMADQFTSLYNELVLSLVPEDQRGNIDRFNFAGYDTIKKVDNGIHTWDKSKLDFSHLDDVMKNYGKGTVEHKAAKYIKAHAEGRRLLLRGDFMSSKGFDAVKTQNKDILKLYNSKKGTGGPKAAFGDVQYMNEIIKKSKNWTPEKAYAVGGVRIQSFSDYVPRMVFDYVQMIYDLAATKLPAHAYTKESLFVKQFGLTGIKINMSLIPAVAEGGIAPGLDANGNYVWAGESFDFDTAKEIQNADGYTENCGTICVGVSYQHIVKLLSDPEIRMVIPYHKSGLNPIVAHMNKIAEFTDYTTLLTNPGGCQNTMDKNGNKVAVDFNFNEVLHKTGDPKATVRQYLNWCAKNEYKPRFAEFAWHENYYKLIEDFTLYDKNGKYVPQREVRAVFPTKDSAFGSMKDLIQSGLEEDAIVEGKRDSSLSSIVDEIQNTLPKTEAEISEEQVEQADHDLEEVKNSDRDYSYEALTSKPDMMVTDVGGSSPTTVDVVFNPNRDAKSSDPVTYDDSGNVIPLSERFNQANDDIRYSERDTDSVSNRSLLANAFEGVAQNASEKQKIQEYKSQISRIEAEERKLSELNQKIKDLSFAKGPRDTKAIRDLQFKAIQTANRINTMDKILLRLEASKPLQDVLTREKEKVRKREQQKGKEALEAYREKATKAQRELLEKWQESRKKGIDSRQRTAMRHKIKDIVNELNQYLLKGTKDRHVPIGLQKAVAEALNAVNMDTVGADERVAKLNDELLKAKTPEAIQEISKRIDNVREMGDRMDEKLKKLKAAYDEFIDSDDPLIANSHDDAVAAHMMRLIVQVGDTPLRDMTMDQLQAVYDVYKIVLATIRNANKSFKDNKNREISTRANQVMAEIDNLGVKRGKRPVFMDWIEKFGWDGLKPVYAMEHIGSKGLIDAYNNVRAGEDTWAKDIVEAREYYLDKFRKYKYDSWDFEKKAKFTSTTGKNFELTLDQIMSLYAFSKRDQAADHLKYGGIVYDPKTEVVEKTKSGIKVKYNVANATAYNINEETLADIISKLTADQKAFVDEMQTYLSDVMGAKGNEVSLAMYDVKLFREKHYFPLKSAHQYMAKAKEQAQGDVKIKNSGFSKETKPHAKNPIVLSSFMDVWTSHVNEMSMYHAFVLPMEDFYRIYNYATPSKNENMPTESVNAYIENAYGAGATGYIEQMLKDLNGGVRTDSRTGIMGKLIGLHKKGAVFASLSVVVQQPSAIARAAALVDTKYFIGPKVDHKRHKALWDEVKQYAPVAIIKEMGYFDTNMGKSTHDYITSKEYSGFKEKMEALVTDSNYRDEILSKAPALADEIAWCSIWEAVKRETQAQHPGLDVRGEPFLMLAGSRFTEVITKTQVYDSVLSRSANMRSKDTGMKMVTAFMAEPTTSINMIADALLQGKRGNRKYCRATIGAVIASQIINSILVSFVYAGRDDDEDETYAEKYIGTLTREVLDSLNPATYIPFIKDIVSIVQGYDVERSDMAIISDLVNAWRKLSSDNLSAYRKVEEFAGSIAQLFGLPVKNIMRDVRGIYQTIMSFVSGPQTTAAGIRYAIKGAITGKDVSNQKQLYEAYLSGDKAQIARVESRYKDQSSITSAIRKALRENDPRILEAAQAVVSGNAVERARIAREIEAEGNFKLQDIQAAINAEIDKLRKEAKGK